MEFLCYHRDRRGSMVLRDELLQEHWSYMDRYAAEMIARGPTLADDGDTPTGSVHILDLPDPAAARTFAFDEPNYQAGVYRDVLLRRWRNALGRTMWDFPSRKLPWRAGSAAQDLGPASMACATVTSSGVRSRPSRSVNRSMFAWCVAVVSPSTVDAPPGSGIVAAIPLAAASRRLPRPGSASSRSCVFGAPLMRPILAARSATVHRRRTGR
jgi:uncharacterized protein YciI